MRICDFSEYTYDLKRILAWTSQTILQRGEGCMERWRDKTKATYFTQLGIGAGRFFGKPRQICFFFFYLPNQVEFHINTLEDLHYAE